MIINKGTWHYKLMKHCWERTNDGYRSFRPPETLCSYFWSFWFNLFFYSFLYFFFLPIIVYFLTFETFMGTYFYLLKDVPLSPPVVLSLFAYLIATIIVAVIYSFKLHDEKFHLLKDDSFIKLAGEAVKARKQKMCPLIEYKG